MECTSFRETRCWYLVGLLSLSPDLHCNPLGHGAAGSSHVTTEGFPNLLCSLTHHHQLAILPVASISSPPVRNGWQGYFNSPRVCTSWPCQGPSSLPLPAGKVWRSAVNTSKAASWNPKTRQRHGAALTRPGFTALREHTKASLLYFCSSPAVCRPSAAFPTQGSSALVKLLKVRIVRHTHSQELPWPCTTRLSMAGAEDQG